VLVLTALVAPASAAGPAAHVEQQDADDTRSPLDMREVEATADSSGLTFTLVIFSAPSKQVADRGFFVVAIEALSFGRSYAAVVRTSRRRISGVLFRRRAGRDSRVGTLPVWHPDRRSVAFRIPPLVLTMPPEGVQWRAQSVFTGRRCKRVCFDRVPDGAPATLPAAPALVSLRLRP
jgi:hypothetical protein